VTTNPEITLENTEMSDSELPRVSLSDAAYLRLRADIVYCRLEPGTRVTEKQLAAEIGLSISPVRDALTRLDHEGLVRTLPRKGYQVTPISLRSIDELFEVWSIIGPEILSRGVERATERQIQEIARGVAEIEEVGSEGADRENALKLVRLLDETFGIFAVAAGNSHLATFFVRLSGEMARVWSLILLADPDALDLSASWLRHIVEQRDGAAAARSARQNIKRIHKRVQEIVSGWPSVMDSEVIAVRLTPPTEPAPRQALSGR
jgi:DNA-binding GntR family transcriptional regulator